MTRLEPIKTQFGVINLFDDGDLWIQQNNLTKAMGYNKFLSLKYSRLGQFIKNAHAMKKFGNVNVLELRKVVESILPAFLDGFFRELHGQPSRRQFFGKEPNEIFNRTKILFETLKEKIMSYDANSLEAKKGALGEKIVKEFLESKGCAVSRPADTFKSGASIVDFIYDDNYRRNYAEVKTQIARPFGVENAPCYSFPKSRVEAYKRYVAEHDEQLDIFVVDPENGFIYVSYLEGLEEKVTIDARDFPFDKYIESMGGEFHYWHRKQFLSSFPIPDEDLAELRKLFGIEQIATCESPVTANDDCVSIPVPEVDSPKNLLEKLAAFANVGKAELTQTILDLRQKKFDREQAQMKELLL